MYLCVLELFFIFLCQRDYVSSTKGGREGERKEGGNNEEQAARGANGTPEIDRSPKYETITTIPKGVS